MSLLNNKYGCWIVNGVPFETKLEALFYANQVNSPNVQFYFHDHIWANFDQRLLGKVSLPDLYKERAQQIRDKYDYLVLHYSGGSDSHNILHTFLTNNIKLDEIYVRWAKPLVDGKFYTPNSHDKSAKNGASEWDFTIKPTLEKVRASNPEIKINVVDFTDNISKEYSVETLENRIVELGMYRGALGSFVQRLDQGYEERATTVKLQSVGHIFGVEKPLVSFNGTDINVCFQDSMMETALMPNRMQEAAVELFYWSHELPLLPMEQAYQVGLFFKNRQKRLLSMSHLSPDDPVFRKDLDQMLDIQKFILYKDS